MDKKTFIFGTYPSTLGQYLPHGYNEELLQKYKKIDFTIHFEQQFTTCSIGVGI